MWFALFEQQASNLDVSVVDTQPVPMTVTLAVWCSLVLFSTPTQLQATGSSSVEF